MRIPSFLLTCAAAGITLGAAEFNPMQWPEYQQTLTLEFADADAAQKAAITVRPLPGRKTLVFSARWDDTTASHANTIEIMHRQGAKGT
ncbi:MAG: hypothetical protein J6R85_03520, partial [Lentisphaeria bacterium]|nr:hypothetical protein [Lentisphaeria bacterium]